MSEGSAEYRYTLTCCNRAMKAVSVDGVRDGAAPTVLYLTTLSQCERCGEQSVRTESVHPPARPMVRNPLNSRPPRNLAPR